MKKLIISLVVVLLSWPLWSQSLIAKYKQGPVHLRADKAYAQNNNWTQVFRSYYDTMYDRSIGGRKSLFVTPEGEVVVSHRYRNYFSLFDQNGRFVKEFGISGGEKDRLKTPEKIEGMVDSRVFYTGADNLGRVTCFDRNGKYVKTLKLDYSVHRMISLPGNKIAVEGWSLWKGKTRNFVAIVDYETNKEKVVWETANESAFLDCSKANKMFSYTYCTKSDKIFNISTMPYQDLAGMSVPPLIEEVNGNLVVAIPSTGEIMIYSTDGKLIRKNKPEKEQRLISVEEQKKIQQKAIDNMREGMDKRVLFDLPAEESRKARETILRQMEDDLARIKDPIRVPYFANVIKDSDGNLLFFVIPEEEGNNSFDVWIYDQGGKFVCQSSFVCDDYNLAINNSKMVFYKGFIYSLQTLKEAKGNPLRLVRFTLD